MPDPELESFKTSIDLRAYAASQGYQLDRKESWRGSAVMRHVNGDKIIIKRDRDSHYVYFSVRDDRDHGTILDFVQERLGLNLGALRKELRPWLGRQPDLPSYPPLEPVPKDRLRAEKAYAAMSVAVTHPYLEIERALPSSLLGTERFRGRIKRDRRGNAIFPHFDLRGLCGFEIKNRNFTGFASGGQKGLWLSHETADDQSLVITESAIDALSHAVLFPSEHSRYASIAGQISPMQRELLRAAAARMPREARIVAATDADEAGAALAEIIREAVELTGRDDLSFMLRVPIGFKDWNDQLRDRPSRGVVRPPAAPSVA